MNNLPNFDIKPFGEISKEFLKREILTFTDAIQFVRKLNYKTNSNNTDLSTVFIDQCGTCCTKHALLKVLADENDFTNIKLMLGLFKMNDKNTKKIGSTLKKNGLSFIPETHNYLKFENTIFDFTSLDSKSTDFVDDLIQEIEILPRHIPKLKVEIHKKYLQNWLDTNSQIKLTLTELWTIREECIDKISMC